MQNYKDLEAQISYTFNNQAHLENALTHSSYFEDHRRESTGDCSYERYEFLGDAVLQLIISDELFHRFDHYSEGQLSKLREHLVCGNTLLSIAKRIPIWDLIRKGKSIEQKRFNEKILQDVIEALIAAVYLDSEESYKITRNFVLSLIGEELDKASSIRGGDYITLLQEFVQTDKESVVYVQTNEEGPDHDKLFYFDVLWNNNCIGHGTGKTKKEARQMAAREALILFGLVRSNSECT